MLMTLAELWKNTLIHVVDVLLVAYIFYRILLLLKGTRSVQVLLGVVVLAVLTFIVQHILKLPTLSWLLRTFWLAWVVVLAVVFQPELRSLLAKLGSQRFGHFLLPNELGFIDEILSALEEASQNKIGMLIVLEQETGLRNYVETGTVINGEISKDLLLTIFQHNTILHDGAIIIQENKLVAAGCVLPLSGNPDLSRVLGTRHRAAIGMTESSDAVVLVVSEETGTISVARDGKLDRGADLKELKPRLLDLYKARRESGLLRKAAPRA
ncbi:MAG TPA: diadenylate cyclase CdaA [Elusimicrobiota bacterium]|nr:diadenylate cyclase CdaA [Elusimicrobiota bacterium]